MAEGLTCRAEMRERRRTLSTPTVRSAFSTLAARAASAAACGERGGSRGGGQVVRQCGAHTAAHNVMYIRAYVK